MRILGTELVIVSVDETDLYSICIISDSFNENLSTKKALDVLKLYDNEEDLERERGEEEAVSLSCDIISSRAKT